MFTLKAPFDLILKATTLELLSVSYTVVHHAEDEQTLQQ